MIDAPSTAALQNTLRRESRSLMHYVRDAFPWTTTEEREALAHLNRIIVAEQAAAAELARFLTRRHIPLPYLSAYPDFTGINFVTIDHLLPILIQEQKKSLSQLEADQAAATDADARSQLDKIAAVKRQHLSTLETMAVAQTPSTAA